jgi:hypothetical protein
MICQYLIKSVTWMTGNDNQKKVLLRKRTSYIFSLQGFDGYFDT